MRPVTRTQQSPGAAPPLPSSHGFGGSVHFRLSWNMATRDTRTCDAEAEAPTEPALSALPYVRLERAAQGPGSQVESRVSAMPAGGARPARGPVEKPALRTGAGAGAEHRTQGAWLHPNTAQVFLSAPIRLLTPGRSLGQPSGFEASPGPLHICRTPLTAHKTAVGPTPAVLGAHVGSPGSDTAPSHRIRSGKLARPAGCAGPPGRPGAAHPEPKVSLSLWASAHSSGPDRRARLG